MMKVLLLKRLKPLNFDRNQDFSNRLSDLVQDICLLVVLMAIIPFTIQAQQEQWHAVVSPGQYTVAEYSNGKIWCGSSAGGVASYDLNQHSIEVFSRQNEGLLSNNVLSSVVDGQNNLWVGTLNGVSVRQNGIWTQYSRENSSMPLAVVYDLCIDNSGSIWAAGEDGVAVFREGAWTGYNSSNSGMPFTSTKTIAASADGDIIAGAARFQAGQSFARFSENSWSAMPLDGLRETGSYTATNLLFDTDGILWIATERRGVFTWNGSMIFAYDAFNSPFPNTDGINIEYIWDMHQAADGSMVFTANGLFQLHPDRSWSVYRTANDFLPTDYVYGIAEDEQGVFWLSSVSSLISFNGETAVEHTVFPMPLESNHVTDITPLPSGGIAWVGGKGPGIIKGGVVSTWTAENAPFRGEHMISVRATGENNIIAATFGLGVYQYNGSEWRELGGPGQEFEPRFIHTVEVENSTNIIWISTDVGLFRVNGEQVDNFWAGSTSDYPLTRALDVEVLENGDVWVAGYQNGLAVLRNGTWTHVTAENSELLTNNVNEIHKGVGNSLWVTYADQVGISHIGADGAYTTFTTENSDIPFNTAMSIAADGIGNTWFAFPESVGRFDGAEWTFFTEANSGITGIVFQAIAVDADNNVWIGTNANGINFFGSAQTVDVAEHQTPLMSSMIASASIFPNPATETVHVKLQLVNDAPVEVEVVDQSGKVLQVKRQAMQRSGSIATIPLDISALTQGMHFVRLKAGQSYVTLPLVKIK